MSKSDVVMVGSNSKVCMSLTYTSFVGVITALLSDLSTKQFVRCAFVIINTANHTR
jgi:hypothetical protein